MLKPIEVGCKAMIINSVHGRNGKIVTVLEFIGESVPFLCNDAAGELNKIIYHRAWRIDFLWINYLAHTQDVTPEHCLMRIDDPDLEEQISNEIGETIRKKLGA